MKATLTVACIFLKSVWQAVSLRSALTALLLAPLCVLCAAAAPEPTAKPNLVIIFTDDMGYADIGAYGCKDIPTPHLDRLAAEGTRFTSAYTVAPICVPSRMGLMSGKFPARFGVFNNVYTPEENQLWMQQTTLADVLKSRGYRTANVGKWHLSGNSSGHSGNDLGGFQFKPPHERGFDEFVGITGGMNSFWKGTELARLKDGKYERFKSPDYLTDFFGTEACEFIQRVHTKNQEPATKNKEPFFLYLAFNAPHAPLDSLDEDQAAIEAGYISPDRRKYAAMVRAIDRNVGRVMDKLQELGLADNTLIVLASDNGGVAKTRYSEANRPFREGKGTHYEGGVRVPLAIRWPGHIPPDSSCDVPVQFADFLPTFCEAAGVTPDSAHPLDGVSLFPLFAQGTLPDRSLFLTFPHYMREYAATPVRTVIQNRYKLVWHPFDHIEIDGDKISDRTLRYVAEPRIELFDLLEDPSERQNLAQKMPGKVAELQKLYEEWMEKIGAKNPVPNPGYDPADPLFNARDAELKKQKPSTE